VQAAEVETGQTHALRVVEKPELVYSWTKKSRLPAVHAEDGSAPLEVPGQQGLIADQLTDGKLPFAAYVQLGM
jgi:hypothetical protein